MLNLSRPIHADENHPGYTQLLRQSLSRSKCFGQYWIAVNRKVAGSSPVCRAKHFDFERRVLLVNDRDANSSEMANTLRGNVLSRRVYVQPEAAYPA